VRRPGAPLGTRREIKNLNSFRFLQQAVDYEVKWQIGTLEDGGRIEQATVLFDPASGETRAMRTKEDAHDYRYFPDPDLLPLVVSEDWLDRVRGGLPELPQAKRERYRGDYGLSAYDAGLLTQSRETAAYFEDMVARLGTQAAKVCANWVSMDLASALNRDNLDIAQSPVPSVQLAGLVARIRDNTLSGKMAREVFDAMWKGEAASADELIGKKGLKQISDSGALEAVIDQVIAANPKSVEEYRAGKEKAFNALVGQAMKATRGKGNPAQINEILRKKLAV